MTDQTLMASGPKTYTLIGADGRPYSSTAKGTLGGHRRTKIFGRLDCPAALMAIARGGYIRHRVFFADTAGAQKAGYRPCAVCMPDAYREWKDTRNETVRRAGHGSSRGNRAVESRTVVRR